MTLVRASAWLGVLIVVILSVVPRRLRPHVMGDSDYELFTAYLISAGLLAIGYLGASQCSLTGQRLRFAPACFRSFSSRSRAEPRASRRLSRRVGSRRDAHVPRQVIECAHRPTLASTWQSDGNARSRYSRPSQCGIRPVTSIKIVATTMIRSFTTLMSRL